MRSTVLAEEAISRGYECIFVGEVSGLDWVTARISNIGFSKVTADTFSFEPERESDILVLDTYSIPVSDRFIAKKNWKLVLNISDAITPKYESDVELRPGLMVIESQLESPKLLSGPEYVLIRGGIEKSRRAEPLGGATKVLIVGGGSDPFGFVTSVAKVLCSLNLNLEVHTFTDGSVPQDSKVKFVKHSMGLELDFIANEVDVVFTTASTSSLEFIAREIATGVVCAVENQADYYEQLGRLGYATQLGMFNSNKNWEFNLPAIREMLESQAKRDSLRNSIHGLIDFKGATRVINVLESFI